MWLLMGLNPRQSVHLASAIPLSHVSLLGSNNNVWFPWLSIKVGYTGGWVFKSNDGVWFQLLLTQMRYEVHKVCVRKSKDSVRLPVEKHESGVWAFKWNYSIGFHLVFLLPLTAKWVHGSVSWVTVLSRMITWLIDVSQPPGDNYLSVIVTCFLMLPVCWCYLSKVL